MQSGATVNMYICSWGYSGCGTVGSDIGNAALTPGQNYMASLDPSQKYQVVFANGSAPSQLVITTAPQGIPAGTATIQAIGTFGGVTRKIETTLPQR